MRHAAALACMLLLAACAHATPTHDDGIALPRTPMAGERVFLEVELGVIGSGTEIAVRTPDGRLLGTVSPHAVRPGNAAGTYVVPVPANMLPAPSEQGHLHLRFLVERAGAPPRPAHAGEVRGVRVIVTSEEPPH